MPKRWITEIRYRSFNGESIGTVTHGNKASAAKAMAHAKANPQTVLSARLYYTDEKGKRKLSYETRGWDFNDDIPF